MLMFMIILCLELQITFVLEAQHAHKSTVEPDPRLEDNRNNFSRQILTSSGSVMRQLASLSVISIRLTRFVTVDYFCKFPTSKADRVVITFPVV